MPDRTAHFSDTRFRLCSENRVESHPPELMQSHRSSSVFLPVFCAAAASCLLLQRVLRLEFEAELRVGLSRSILGFASVFSEVARIDLLIRGKTLLLLGQEPSLSAQLQDRVGSLISFQATMTILHR